MRGRAVHSTAQHSTEPPHAEVPAGHARNEAGRGPGTRTARWPCPQRSGQRAGHTHHTHAARGEERERESDERVGHAAMPRNLRARRRAPTATHHRTPASGARKGAVAGGPARGGPLKDGPSRGGPSAGGPARGPPAGGGPAEGPPAEGEPAAGGPAAGGPARGRPTPPRAQRTRTRAPTTHRRASGSGGCGCGARAHMARSCATSHS